MLLMAQLIFAKDQDIVQVHHTCDVQEFSECLNKEGLEHSRSICETKRHGEIFKKPKLCTERSLPFISALDLYSIIRILAVQLCEFLGSLEPVQHIQNKG